MFFKGFFLDVLLKGAEQRNKLYYICPLLRFRRFLNPTPSLKIGVYVITTCSQRRTT